MMIDDNDAAKMDVFNTDIIEHVSKEQKRESIKLRGKYAKYSPVNGLQRILVYRNKKLTSDLTGDFRIVTQPDEIHIGSWPLFYSVLWDVPAVKKNQKYYDSAVILKWNPYPILPGEEQYYTTIFGIYNKGILDLVPAGTNYAGVDKKGRRITLSPPEFTVSPDTIYEGQTASLSWKLENPLNAEVYVSAKPKTKQRDKGRISVKPKTSTAYYLQMLDNGKQIANVKAKLVVLKRPKNHEFDGRFTIGSGKKAISFGYPFPYSTSYFQLYSNKKYYSNNRGLLKAEYLPGKQEEFVADDKKNILSYETKEFNIEQTLIPLDEEYKKTEKRNAKFFRVQYIVKNKGKYKATYSFKQFLDLSSFVSDSLNLKINGHPSRFNISYTGKDIPKTVLFSDNSALSDIKLLTVASGSEKPRSVSIADWHFLQDLKVSRKYSDSIFYKNPAVLIWWKKTVLAGEKLKFAFILGSKQVDSIAYLYNKAEELKTLTVNFETNSNKISKKSTTKIVDYIKKNKFDFIVLNGFADSRGTLENNYKLAEKRINSIKELILKKGSVDSSKILKKVHGEFFSNQKTNKEEIDDANERKVNIVLYRIK